MKAAIFPFLLSAVLAHAEVSVTETPSSEIEFAHALQQEAADEAFATLAKISQNTPSSDEAVSLSDDAPQIMHYLALPVINWQGMPNRLRSPIEVRELYAQTGYRPLWAASGKITPLAASVIAQSQNAWQHGLRADVYHSNAMTALTAGQSVDDPIKFDIILTDAFITLKKHLANGIVDPSQQFSTWNQSPEVLDFYELYQSAVASGTADQILDIHTRDYQALKQAYIDVMTHPELQNHTPQIPISRLKLGRRGDAVVMLRERLGLPTDSNLYDRTVRQAVKDYQKAHGLAADGVAGQRTITHINTLNDQGHYPEKLKLNMERLRWQSRPVDGKYVWVNIPAYKMAIRNGDQFEFESNVIVGRTQRQTPIFADHLKYVVLAPYWNVPKTIFQKDKLPRLKKDPHALGSNIQVIDKATGEVVSPDTVDWQSGGKGYRLRGVPGPSNALGYMKFLFPNRHAIYLHDTPSRHLFKRSIRALSSGCVRVERAEDLALFLLNDRGYDRSRIRTESRRRREKWIDLPDEKRYPIYLSYYTAWTDSDGQVRYSGDIYDYDKPLEVLYNRALNQL